jgi:DNA-binding NtrC family response regulator
MYENDPVSIFLVEDDPAYSKFLQYVLSLNPDFEVTTFETGQDCLDNLHKKPAIISLDFSLPDINGDEVLKAIREFDPEIKVIIVSAQEEVGTAIKLLKLGAYDYITKDEETKDLLLNAINNARKNISLTREVEHLKEEISHQYDFKHIIGLFIFSYVVIGS